MLVSFHFEVMSNIRLMKKSFPFLWGFPLATSDSCIAGDAVVSAPIGSERRGEVDGQGPSGTSETAVNNYSRVF